jgi:hypothetical protein
MGDPGLQVELAPGVNRMRRRRRDVTGHIGLLVPELLCPVMLVALADLAALRVMMILTQVQSIDAALS